MLLAARGAARARFAATAAAAAGTRAGKGMGMGVSVISTDKADGMGGVTRHTLADAEVTCGNFFCS
ncbi:hypothetical protein GCM10017322_40630 [Paracoccus aerius]|nr:hypothetical protein GCM10017322_40630 [Paracoccus aerius]